MHQEFPVVGHVCHDLFSCLHFQAHKKKNSNISCEVCVSLLSLASYGGKKTRKTQKMERKAVNITEP